MANKFFKYSIVLLAILCCNGITQADNAQSATQIKDKPDVNPVINNNNNEKKASSVPPLQPPKILGVNTATPAVTNTTAGEHKQCVCDGLLLPRILEDGKELEICPECKCKMEARNTTLIKVVVIIVIWIISILVIYMLFLICLDPLLNKRVKSNYQEHTNEDDETASTGVQSQNQEMTMRANVLNRGMTKWKRQVLEQRRRIYDRHTMLN